MIDQLNDILSGDWWKFRYQMKVSQHSSSDKTDTLPTDTSKVIVRFDIWDTEAQPGHTRTSYRYKSIDFMLKIKLNHPKYE